MNEWKKGQKKKKKDLTEAKAICGEDRLDCTSNDCAAFLFPDELGFVQQDMLDAFKSKEDQF